jgi:hypothetical protein
MPTPSLADDRNKTRDENDAKRRTFGQVALAARATLAATSDRAADVLTIGVIGPLERDRARRARQSA